MVKIGFLINLINVRGTTQASYDYALYNELILKNTSIIFAPYSAQHDTTMIMLFKEKFPIFFYKDISNLDNIIVREECDILYIIKYGKTDDFTSNIIKTIIHCVFDMSEPHGNVYAAVSENLAKKYNNSIFVPHMISLKQSKYSYNFRFYLNIPQDALVFGRYGGEDTFNIPFVKEIIKIIVNSYPNVYFLFANTPEFYNHKQIIHLQKIFGNDEKNRFISTCDAHLEANDLGHTFGLACGEFSINNKPIILYNGYVWNTAHFDIIKDKGIYFKTPEEFYNIITSWKKQDYEGKDWNCYKDYNPENVMLKFKQVFIDNISLN